MREQIIIFSLDKKRLLLKKLWEKFWYDISLLEDIQDEQIAFILEFILTKNQEKRELLLSQVWFRIDHYIKDIQVLQSNVQQLSIVVQEMNENHNNNIQELKDLEILMDE